MSANSHQDQPPRVRLDGEVVGLLLLVVAFLLGLILFLPLLSDQGEGGALAQARRILLDWAGWLAWLLPAAAFAYGVAAFTSAPMRELTRWVLGGLLAVLGVLCLQAFFMPGQNGHPGPAGWLAEGLVRKLKQVLGLATPLLLLLAAAPAFAAPAACPQVDEQLSEYLAGAKQRIGFDGEVRVEFDVNAAGRAQLVAVAGSRPYQAWVRNAVDSLECQAGAPQRYVLNIRFVDPAPRAVASAASATLAQAKPATTSTPR